MLCILRGVPFLAWEPVRDEVDGVMVRRENLIFLRVIVCVSPISIPHVRKLAVLTVDKANRSAHISLTWDGTHATDILIAIPDSGLCKRINHDNINNSTSRSHASGAIARENRESL
jgi:hypothetical protein